MRKIRIRIFYFILCLYLLSSALYAGDLGSVDGHALVFEKGDIIYRRGKLPSITYWEGHSGIFYGWPYSASEFTTIPPTEADTQDSSQYATVEAIGVGFPEIWLPASKGDIAKFLADGSQFWGVHTANLTRLQRAIIAETAKNQIGIEYRPLWGYKNPGLTFRCDGLAEHCYEMAGVDLIPGDTWLPLIAAFPGRNFITPKRQMQNSLLLSERTSAEVETVELVNVLQNGEAIEPDENDIYYIYDRPIPDIVTIEVNVSDGDHGSGIRMTDFWVGAPDDTPDTFEGNNSGKRIGIDDHTETVGGIYKADWNIDDFEPGEYTLHILAYDQAGNVKNISINVWKNQYSPTRGGFWENSSGELEEANYSSTTGLIHDAETGIPFDTAPWTFGGTPTPLYPYCGNFGYEYAPGSANNLTKFWNGSSWVNIPAFPYQNYRNDLPYPYSKVAPVRAQTYETDHLLTGYKFAYLNDNNSWQETPTYSVNIPQAYVSSLVSFCWMFDGDAFLLAPSYDYHCYMLKNGVPISDDMHGLIHKYNCLIAHKNHFYFISDNTEYMWNYWIWRDGSFITLAGSPHEIFGAGPIIFRDGKIVYTDGNIYHYFDGSSWHYYLQYSDLSELYGKLYFNGIWTFF